MAAKRPARPSLIRISQVTTKSRTIGPIAIQSIVRHAAVALIASMVVTAAALTEPAAAENGFAKPEFLQFMFKRCGAHIWGRSRSSGAGRDARPTGLWELRICTLTLTLSHN